MPRLTMTTALPIIVIAAAGTLGLEKAGVWGGAWKPGAERPTSEALVPQPAVQQAAAGPVDTTPPARPSPPPRQAQAPAEPAAGHTGITMPPGSRARGW